MEEFYCVCLSLKSRIASPEVRFHRVNSTRTSQALGAVPRGGQHHPVAFPITWVCPLGGLHPQDSDESLYLFIQIICQIL